MLRGGRMAHNDTGGTGGCYFSVLFIWRWVGSLCLVVDLFVWISSPVSSSFPQFKRFPILLIYRLTSHQPSFSSSKPSFISSPFLSPSPCQGPSPPPQIILGIIHFILTFPGPSAPAPQSTKPSHFNFPASLSSLPRSAYPSSILL